MSKRDNSNYTSIRFTKKGKKKVEGHKRQGESLEQAILRRFR